MIPVLLFLLDAVLRARRGVYLKCEHSTTRFLFGAELAEKGNVAHTGEIFPGPLTAGMTVKAVHGLSPMDPVFGGMLLSGKKAAE